MRITLPNQVVVLLCCVALLPTVTQVCAGQDLSSEDVYKKVSPSVMVLLVQTKDGRQAVGSAFLALKDGIAVTSWHLIRLAGQVQAKFSDGQEFEVSGLVDKDEKRDVALVRVKVFGRPLLECCATEPAVGAKAYVIGAPRGLDFTVSDGLVSQVRLENGTKYYQFSCAASPGNSGGPLVNANGEVLGTVSFQFAEGQNLNFAMPSTYVLGLDSSLPTKPWDQVKNDEQALTKAGEDEAEQLLADAVVADHDCGTAVTGVYQMFERPVYKEGNFWNDYRGKWQMYVIPPYLYSASDAAASAMKRLSQTDFPDWLRPVARHVLDRLSTDAEVMALLIQCITEVQTSRGWSSKANNLSSQAQAKLSAPPTLPSAESWNKLLASKAFDDRVPSDLCYVLGITPDPSGFRLGVAVFWRNPLYLVVVPKDSFAYSLGLRSDDLVVSAGETTFSTIQELKACLKTNAGKSVKLIVRRDGKAKTLDIKVPADMPKDGTAPK